MHFLRIQSTILNCIDVEDARAPKLDIGNFHRYDHRGIPLFVVFRRVVLEDEHWLRENRVEDRQLGEAHNLD